jgi:hypothetical protein
MLKMDKQGKEKRKIDNYTTSYDIHGIFGLNARRLKKL